MLTRDVCASHRQPDGRSELGICAGLHVRAFELLLSQLHPAHVGVWRYAGCALDQIRDTGHAVQVADLRGMPAEMAGPAMRHVVSLHRSAPAAMVKVVTGVCACCTQRHAQFCISQPCTRLQGEAQAGRV